MINALRILIGVGYLLGSTSHIYLALRRPDVYGAFGQTATPLVRGPWLRLVMPHIRFLATLMGLYEIAIGALTLAGGRFTRLGLAGGILFNFCVVQLGLAWPTADRTKDLLVNRLPNAAYGALHVIPLWNALRED